MCFVPVHAGGGTRVDQQGCWAWELGKEGTANTQAWTKLSGPAWGRQ